MTKRKQQYDYNAIPDAEYFLRMRYNAPDNANVFGVGGGAGTFVETTQETNPGLYQQQIDTQNQNKFLNSMSDNSNAMAGVMGGINNAITVLQDPNSSNAQKVFGALGIGAASKIWEGDTSKVDNAIKDAQAQMQTGKNNLIQDASSVSGAMNGLKANSIMPRQRINFTPTYYNDWEELKGGKGGFWKNMGTATLQGAANGSIGGPWGAAGGAIAGIVGSVAGLFGRKSRYQKAMKAANERMNYMVNAARGFNMEQDFAEKAANQNLISNGINTQRTLDMANFRAYGGNLFDGGGNLTDEQQMVLADIQADPRILFTPKYSKWRDYIRRTSPDYLDRLYTSLPYEQQKDIYQNDREAWGALSNKAKGDFGGTQVRKKTDEISPYVAGALGLVGAAPAMEAVAMFPMLENGLNTYFGYEGAKNLPTAVTDAYDYAKKGDWSRAGLSAGEAALDGMFIGNGIKGAKSLSELSGVPKNTLTDIKNAFYDVLIDPFLGKVGEFRGYPTNPSLSDKRFYTEKPIPEDVKQNFVNNVRDRYYRSKVGDYKRKLERATEDLNTFKTEDHAPSFKEAYENMLNDEISNLNRLSDPNFIDNLANGTYYEYTPIQASLHGGELGVAHYNPNYNAVVAGTRSGGIRRNGPHEIRHRMQNLSDYEEPDVLVNKAFTSTFDKAVSSKYGLSSTGSSLEKETTLLDTRNNIIGDRMWSEYVPLEEQIKIIDSKTDKEILKALKDSNGYGYYYVKELEKNPKECSDAIKALRDALKYSAVIMPPVVGGLISNNNNIEYAMGGNLYTDLSPNMMAMQQEKQDNDRLKALNQPFSLGLGNSFNQKMNMFPTGGPIDPPRELEIPSTTAVKNTTDSLYVDNTLSPAQKAVLGGTTPTDYALAVTKEALDAERAKAKQNTQTVINMLYGDRHGEADNGNRYDFGGTMKNLPSEMQSYETGGTHEQNPYGGIQIGTDRQGNPNLVEQGEFRYGDYIFSDRIPVNYDTLFDFGLIASVPKKKPKKGQKKTYADYAKDLVNKTGDPNDPITKRTNDANLQRLANAEEYQKAAEQGQLALDDSLNEYKSALKNGVSPMYGSMKYNGMNGGADPMDASSLTNVSRSGTPMMAAYGGNLFAIGGRPYNPLVINDPLAINRYKITPTIDNPMPIVNRGILDDYTDNTQAFNRIDNNPEWTENDPWQAYNELNKYYDPHEIAALRQSYGMQPQGGVDEAFVKALQTDLKNKGYYKGSIDGDFGPQSRAALDAMNGTNAWTPYKANAPVPANTQFNGTLAKYNSYSTSNSSSTSKGRFAGNDAAKTAVEGMTNVHTTDQNSPQAPVENTGTIPPQTGQNADVTKWDFNKHRLPTQGKWATVGLNAIQAGADANGFTNPDFNPNFNDANRLERKGEASTFARTNAHIGGYQAPDITDIQSPLAQAAQQQQATNRALQNIGGGRNAAASIIANDYNAGQTMGDIVTKVNAQNAANRMAAAEINRGIDQFNAQSDNDMYKDNLNAQINGQQMNLNATQAANENRLRQMLYQDATNRQAHQNIVTNQNQMYNNVLNMIADQAARNEEWNLINSKHNQDFYFDPKTGGWEYKGDSGAYSKLNNALATIYPDMPMTGLSADVQKEWNNLLQSKGGQNITDDEIRWIVDMERNAQIEQKAKREHELKLAELNRANTAKANGGYISNKMRNKYTNFDYNAI